MGEIMNPLSFIILPFVLILGALHFVMLFIVKLLGMKRAELTTFKHLIALDIYANTLLGGDHRETISSRLGRNPNCRLCNLVCRFLNIFDPDHCSKSAEAYRKMIDNG
jgi:hypothetical protein